MRVRRSTPPAPYTHVSTAIGSSMLSAGFIGSVMCSLHELVPTVDGIGPKLDVWIRIAGRTETGWYTSVDGLSCVNGLLSDQRREYKSARVAASRGVHIDR